MSRKPWWNPDDNDDWDEPLPPVVTLEPEYSVELPLGGDGVLAWQRTKFSPQLLDRLAAWKKTSRTDFTTTQAGAHSKHGTSGPHKPKNLKPKSAQNWAVEPNL